LHGLLEAEFGLIGAGAPGVSNACAVVVGVAAALFVTEVVEVVDGDEPFVVVDGDDAPPEPVGLGLVVVVVVVRHTPRRCASGPQVEAVASV
jgi:hypothetical protein